MRGWEADAESKFSEGHESVGSERAPPSERLEQQNAEREVKLPSRGGQNLPARRPSVSGRAWVRTYPDPARRERA
jgi:hypothetical protein